MQVLNANIHITSSKPPVIILVARTGKVEGATRLSNQCHHDNNMSNSEYGINNKLVPMTTLHVR